MPGVQPCELRIVEAQTTCRRVSHSASERCVSEHGRPGVARASSAAAPAGRADRAARMRRRPSRPRASRRRARASARTATATRVSGATPSATSSCARRLGRAVELAVGEDAPSNTTAIDRGADRSRAGEERGSDRRVARMRRGSDAPALTRAARARPEASADARDARSGSAPLGASARARGRKSPAMRGRCAASNRSVLSSSATASRRPPRRRTGEVELGARRCRARSGSTAEPREARRPQAEVLQREQDLHERRAREVALGHAAPRPAARMARARAPAPRARARVARVSSVAKSRVAAELGAQTAACSRTGRRRAPSAVLVAAGTGVPIRKSV